MINRDIANEIFEKLAQKGAFRENLPFHLDKKKFRHCVINDIEEVLNEERK